MHSQQSIVLKAIAFKAASALGANIQIKAAEYNRVAAAA
jgi:hypothetical protein